MLIQKCPMCLEKKEVVSSHLFPAALYATLRSVDNSSPLRVGDEVVMPTDRQIQQPLLCKDCEDTLNKGGETWTIPKLLKKTKAFPLYESLMNFPAAIEVEPGGLYFAAENPDVDVAKLTHFGMGIFWKASVSAWKAKEKDPMIQLGPYSNPIRTWLLGKSGFPRNVCISLTLSKPDRALMALHGPIAGLHERWHIFFFYVPGVMYTLNVGRVIDPEMRKTCFHTNTTHPILVSDQITGQLWTRLGKQFRESRKTNSYLAAKAKRNLQPRT
jgi:hypothetical protein